MLLVGLLFAAVGQPALAGDRKEWVRQTDCHYVEGKDNDGDSFRVHGTDKEFTARLYYVDAPETNLRRVTAPAIKACISALRWMKR
jgi:endonuclease YncB( thermonuclease family)